MKPGFVILFALSLVPATRPSTPEIPKIQLHVALITDRPEAAQAATPEAIQWLAENLSQEFHAGDGTPLARFEIGKFSSVSDVKQLSPEYLDISEYGDFRANKKTLMKSAIFRKDSLNIFIYDGSKGSTGGFYLAARRINGVRQKDYFSYLFYEWKALTKRSARLLLHETGHAFGLSHIKRTGGSLPFAEENVMVPHSGAGKPLPEGESGYYFTPSQAAIISKSAADMTATFGRAANGEPLAEPK